MLITFAAVRILFLTSRFPYPLDKGDKLRAFYQIAGLSRHHEITLASVSDQAMQPEDLDALKPFCRRILIHSISKGERISNLIRALFSGKPFQVEYFYSEPFKNKIQKVIEENRTDVIFCQLARMAEYVKDVKGVTKVLDYQDAFSKGYERQAKTESLFKKLPVRMEAKRMEKYERKIFDDFDQKIIISEQDRDLIPHPSNGDIQIIPNGVDVEYYIPMRKEKKYDLIFSGNMNYPPNIESALYIAKRVMPLLLKRKPDAKLVIAGTNPTREILQLQDSHITVTGWVDDIREPMAESRIHLAPMLISIGLQNKILQSMAMKIPCIVSRLANNAIHAPENESILIADNPQEYADKIMQLLDDRSFYERIAENAYRFVHQNFKWETMNRKLEKILIT